MEVRKKSGIQTTSTSLAYEGGGTNSAQDHRSYLSMYAEAPNQEITLEDFEIYSFNRLKVLRAIDQERSRGSKRAELNRKAIELSKKHITEQLADPEGWRIDQVSHHILRLAFCNSEDKRRWYLTQETTLFQARLERESAEQVSNFLSRHGLSFTPVTDDERLQYLSQLRQVYDAVGGEDMDLGNKDNNVFINNVSGEEKIGTFENERYFKVPFTQAKDLVRSRKVFLAGGYAYVPRGRMITIIVNRFRAYLSNMLKQANRFLPAMLADERLEPILKNMSTAYTGPEFNNKGKVGEHVTADDIEGLASTAFPLCMQVMHQALRQQHLLKHDGRMQYGLFLKGLGVSLEDALIFWQREFTKSMSPEDFLKKYAYDIRHNYGKEGKRQDYTPHSCTRIIMGTAPAAGQAHGCPYRHWDANRLRSVLENSKLPTNTVTDIMNDVLKRDYQIACRKQFEAKFPNSDSYAVGNHPNGYAQAAITFLKAQAANKGGNSSSSSSSSSSSNAGTATFSASSPALNNKNNNNNNASPDTATKTISPTMDTTETGGIAKESSTTVTSSSLPGEAI